jgi:hypothetical protein
MGDSIVTLIGRLPGLEAARDAIDKEIKEIHRRIAADSAFKRPNLSLISESQMRESVAQKDILGIDSLGRVKRRRNLSPEVRAHKRELIAKAREVRLRRLQQAEEDKGQPFPQN